MIRRGLVLTLAACLLASAAAADTLTLDGCLQRVRQQNPELQTAASGPRLAATVEQEARSAYRPQVGLDLGYTEQLAAQQVVIEGKSAQTQDRAYAHASLGVDQLLYDFGRTAGRVEAAAASRRAAGFSYAATEQDLLLQAVAAYYRVLTAEALLRADRDEVTQMEAHLRIARALYRQGVVTRNDVLQAQVRLASSRQQVAARQGELENAWRQLNYLTARPAEARGELVADAALPPAPPAGQVTTRPDLLAQAQRVKAAQEEVRQARGDSWPELYAHLGADYVENGHVKEQTIYGATVGLRFNLYDGAARAARLRRALEKLQQERQQLADLRQRAHLAEQNARNDAQVAAKRIDMSTVAIQAAQVNLRINQDRYREQAGTATEVLDAQTQLTQARTDLAQNRFDYQVAVARVRHATGSL